MTGPFRAALVQLTVPALAAIGGVLFIAEPLTVRFPSGIIATAVTAWA